MMSLNDKSPSQMGPRTIRWELVSKLGKGKFENKSCCQTNYQVRRMKSILEDKVVSLSFPRAIPRGQRASADCKSGISSMNPLLISFCMSMAVIEGSWFALLQLSSQI